MDVRTVDYHTASEPFRIVVSDVGMIAGANVGARRETALATDRIDRVRRLLCHRRVGAPRDDQGPGRCRVGRCVLCLRAGGDGRGGWGMVALVCASRLAGVNWLLW
jgi:hypothetical protein